MNHQRRRRRKRSVLCFGALAVCLQVQATTTRVYGLDFEHFHELMDALPACQSSADALQMERKFHSDHNCDRQRMNDPDTRAAHDLRLKKFPPSLFMKIPREQTLYCPPITATNEALLLDEDDLVVVGHRERWILMNEGTKPISISFWWQKERKLVSAFNRYISPAQHDPGAIVNPGQWKIINAWQGHVFVMHQLELVEGELVQDRILATHRVGLVPIGLNFETPPNMDMAATATATKTKKSSSISDKRFPSFDGTDACNVMYKGFINEANYPVNIYFGERRSTFESCQEEGTQRFHLGVHHDHKNNDPGWDDPSQDAHHTLNDWESPLMYDGTYVSHTYVARLHHDPSIIVQKYIVSPVIVRDCLIQEDNEDSTIHEAATVSTTVPIIQDELSMMISTSTYRSIDLAASLRMGNSTLL